jgi:uncharacterized protein (TIGR02271 family)
MMTDTYSNRNLTAFFDDRDEAQDAVSRLRELGIGDASIRMVGGDDHVARSDTDKGFWESLSDLFFPDEDRSTYAEGLRRGGYLVTVTGVASEFYDQAVDILDDEGSVDIDERSASWRSEGWTGESSSAATFGSTAAGAGAADTAHYGETSAARSGDEETIPVVQEQLRIGKRDTNLGRVRVRSYVVEEPVNEQVNLRQDRVEIERRPVDRALGSGDDVFTDRVIEAEEHAEEAVVSKEARVTEEVALRKRSDERTETVSDTVRHTEVEIEDERDLAESHKSRTRK